MSWSPNALNAITAIGVGMSAAERTKLAAAILRTLNTEERYQASSESFEPEGDAHVRKSFARLNRTPAPADSDE
jgi:hypothetical protein